MSTVEAKVLGGIVAVTAVLAVAAIIAGLWQISGILAVCLILESVLLMLVVLRRISNLSSTQGKNTKTRLAQLSETTNQMRSSVSALDAKVARVESAQSALKSSLGDMKKQISQTANSGSLPQATGSATRTEKPTISVIPESGKTRNVADVDIYTVGRRPDDTSLGTSGVVQIYPSSIPAPATVKAGSIVLIDESGFQRGAWKSFGQQHDSYLLGALNDLQRLVQNRGLEVHTVVVDDTPGPFRVTRSWGEVVSSVEQYLDMRSRVQNVRLSAHK